MTNAEFHKELQELAVSFTSDYNSNNSWGFGGAYGSIYTFKTFQVMVATACYRHTSSTKFIKIYSQWVTGFDVRNTTTSRIKALQIIKERIASEQSTK